MVDLEKLESIAGEGRVLRGEPMARHTSFRIGGPADYYICVTRRSVLQELLRYLEEREEPWFILGRGTNLLVGDGGVHGCVITMNTQGTMPATDTAEQKEEETEPTDDLTSLRLEGSTMIAGAGASLAAAAQLARRNGLSGLEFAGGIPGSVGGALVMNAGAYDGSMDMVVAEVTARMPDGSLQTIPVEKLHFGYRHSLFKEIPAIVLEMVLELHPADPEEIGAKMAEFARRRREKQPLEYPSAGSTFKRPEGMFAGKLIMDAGLRGFSAGDAAVSEKHCGFVVNRGNASAAEVRSVIAAVQQKVQEMAGVQLEEEVIYLGEF